MANRYQGEVSIRLDKVRTIKLSMNAFCEFQQLTGKAIDSLFAECARLYKQGLSDSELAIKSADVIGMDKIRALLWVGLRHEDRNLTLEDTGELMEYAEGDGLMEKVQYIFGKLFECYLIKIGGDEKKIAELKKKMEDQPNGTGQPSSESPTESLASSQASSGR